MSNQLKPYTLLLAILLTHGISHASQTQSDLPYKGLLVSSKSLLLLAKEATKGIEQPKRIFSGREIGHHQEIKPSARKLIEEAELIFWYGDEIEASLGKLLEKKKNTVAFLDVKSFNLKKPRPLNPHAKHDEEHDKHHDKHSEHEDKHHDEHGKKHDENDKHADNHEHHDEHGHHHTNDPHIWLDPIRSIQIVNAIAAGRAYLYPKQAAQYTENAKAFSKKMRALAKKHQGNKKTPYIAYHDAYQYAEDTLNVKHVASLSKEPDHPIKPSQIKYVLDKLKQNPTKKVCFFSENINLEEKIPRLMPYITVVDIDPKLNVYDSYLTAWDDFNQKLEKCR